MGTQQAIPILIVKSNRLLEPLKTLIAPLCQFKALCWIFSCERSELSLYFLYEYVSFSLIMEIKVYVFMMFYYTHTYIQFLKIYTFFFSFCHLLFRFIAFIIVSSSLIREAPGIIWLQMCFPYPLIFLEIGYNPLRQSILSAVSKSPSSYCFIAATQSAEKIYSRATCVFKFYQELILRV